MANALIEQLRHDKSRGEILGYDFSQDFDSDALSDIDQSPPEKKRSANSANKKDTGDEVDSKGIAKWEKNVKRRVYDALNVLYAAGVL